MLKRKDASSLELAKSEEDQHGNSESSAEMSKLSREEKLELWRLSKGRASQAHQPARTRLLRPLSSSQVNARQPTSSASSQVKTAVNNADLAHVCVPSKHTVSGETVHDESTLCQEVACDPSPGGSDWLDAKNEQPLLFLQPGEIHMSEGDLREEGIVGASTSEQDGNQIDFLPSSIKPLDSAVMLKDDEATLDHGEHGIQTQQIGEGTTSSPFSADEQASSEELQVQLFDTSNRLAQCTALLQRMVEENEQLRTKVREFRSLKEKCGMLESTIVELKALQQAAESVSEHSATAAQTQQSMSPEYEAHHVHGVECKRQRLGDSTAGCEGETQDGAHDSISTQDKNEIARLRKALDAQSKEISEERQRYMEKVMQSEQRARAAEAAVAENNVWWQQLFDTQMKSLQEQLQQALSRNSSAPPPT